ncbi:MAG TPA: AtpZ/AtpI family protein [Hymenobacter sp.]|jgi:F0F1-type ATP synthase assembly protein I|uniref:AtpZ/AtpI family protein n=1 Tax=Hymenobacter sp. TaxID=1898978 RepID=UPI002ED90317
MPTPSDTPPPGSNRLQAIAKYSGLAFQMLAIIGGSTWLGTWLDARFESKNPWFTIGLMLLGVFVALWQVIRSLTKDVQ